ncbi:amino acid ABC transporter substrate-binding protein [Nocardioides marmotae]|uniref:ABC transporter substrate-binding protein n=1 Tax=Nocardioides marmotae TaxID=2663857 RepID=A0A6I3JF23_9ACTN|nr:amino acid ABC transporter substrate-binding protein [Nocardioides marmotae]MCR6033108.1 ABC transporter substrate-binding protein [Gordonia jinghuaiqii]MBC9732609.1 amino acid ABC transporter substrate-binding protein [Nocardioides marmotae]MTB83727.1 ABC transporter substrate-binding protein [Nocardioides marmotae]MTB96760.1 ABC transporter substrate-binding protein [Nocardioides marmotae]QKE03031.1 amino acid ABC transporter substrate-binding protein [Nocardioides marmotae]
MSHALHRRGLTALVLAGVLASGLAACGGDDSASGGSDDPISIGTSLPLTGEFSQPGQAAEQGYRIWAQTVNDNGGLLGRDVELVVKDDASNQNTIVADYNALIGQDKVDLLLGTFSSLLNLPASAVAEKNQMIYIEPAGGSPEIFSRGFEYLFFAQQATADRQGLVFAEWVANLPEDQRPKTAAYPTLDDPFAAPVVEGARSALEEAGVETVYEETYAIDTRNFDTIVSAMKNADPDLVFHGAQFEDGVGMTRSMLKAGFAPEMFFQTNAPSFGEQYADGVGPDNTEGVFYAVSHHPDADTPGNADFVKAYEAEYGGLPPEDAADAYAAGQVLQTAVEAVGSIDDQGAIADWLRENEVDTILGPLSWDETGAPQGEFLIGQWQDGEAQIVLPEEASTAKITATWTPGGAG